MTIQQFFSKPFSPPSNGQSFEYKGKRYHPFNIQFDKYFLEEGNESPIAYRFAPWLQDTGFDRHYRRDVSDVMFYDDVRDEFFIVAQTGPGRFRIITKEGNCGEWNRNTDEDFDRFNVSHMEFSFDEIEVFADPSMGDYYKVERWLVIEDVSEKLKTLV